MTETISRSDRGKKNMRVTLMGAGTNLVLFFTKLAGGIFGHSDALVADAVHSLSDLLSDLGLILAMHFSSQPPDQEHPYGHERFETLAALGTGTLLALNGTGIGYEAVQRLVIGHYGMPAVWTLYIAAFAIFAKETLYQITIRVARKTRSAALRANAWDHRTDAISSVIVLIGIGGSLLGAPYLDSVVALIVALMVLRIGLVTAWEALQELADRGLDDAVLAQIREVILGCEGVRDLHLLKTRKVGHQALAEVHLQVTNPLLSVSEGHQIAERVRMSLLQAVDDLVDATIHIDSENDEEGGAVLPPRSVIDEKVESGLLARNLPLPQQMTLHYLKDGVVICLRYPFPPAASLESLQAQEKQIQEALQEKVSGLQRVDVAWQTSAREKE
ncbi:cation diffusion facilitator family transporter [Acidithiobacillus thiooxidans]|uniref:Putative transporter YdfM n=1 Tax=Acidithiobacillus thiooxidans ATCC 19377 TaxID=637390 RepID=A0A543Q5A9_ACITH|nr:cation diffusion facilitator family transporter [Acidithiobacillus thiooxidans]MDR7926038.1 cation diffusion facilitator family transporter [Acidithiobacillus thiooxidans]MDX5934373.1 cation diffusion facilitator family transporter [Acidithiobacillus thiooxidans]TQN51513.1 putative transporter YdfM [Acidithiobacillus thiooxidans ATCC 19377]